MKKFLKEFKEFALKGNVIDLAVGVIIGSAFQGIVSSLTENILKPIIGLFASTKDFSDLQINIFGAQIKYGEFFGSVINFIIMAFVIFIIVKAVNRLITITETKEEKEMPSTNKVCPYCMSDIHVEATRCPKCTSEV